MSAPFERCEYCGASLPIDRVHVFAGGGLEGSRRAEPHRVYCSWACLEDEDRRHGRQWMTSTVDTGGDSASPRRALVIDRAKWMRGETGTLLADDGRQCCIGIYLSACGVRDKALKGNATPMELRHDVPSEAAWLLDGSVDSTVTELLVSDNDRRCAESTREESIASLFAAQGIDVSFVGPLHVDDERAEGTR